jgi:predicted DNA-binding transcriptional regulator AlpA
VATEPAARLDFPNTGLVRLHSILAPNGPIPVGRTTWWEGVKSGRFPKPLKLGPRISAWRAEDINRLIEAGVPAATDTRPTHPQSGDCDTVSEQSAETAPATPPRRRGESHKAGALANGDADHPHLDSAGEATEPALRASRPPGKGANSGVAS